MVHIREFGDQYFSEQRPGLNYAYDGYDYPHSSPSSIMGSDEEDEDGDDGYQESLYDRIVALKDMIPVHQRARIVGAFGRAHMVLSGGLKFGGSVLWVVGTSALVLGVPFAVAIGEEQQLDTGREATGVGNAAESLTPGPGGSTIPRRER